MFFIRSASHLEMFDKWFGFIYRFKFIKKILITFEKLLIYIIVLNHYRVAHKTAYILFNLIYLQEIKGYLVNLATVKLDILFNLIYL